MEDDQRKVKFKDSGLVTEFVDQNLWAHGECCVCTGIGRLLTTTVTSLSHRPQ